MTRASQQRLFVALAFTIIGALCGMAAGYGVGCALMVRQGETRLAQYAGRIVNHNLTSTAESREVLARMNGSPYATCSPAEIAYFRELVFNSEFLKSAGRMVNGHIACSTLGANFHPTDSYTPDFREPSGVQVYRNPKGFLIRGKTVIAVQKGNAYVVYGPDNLLPLASDSMHYAITWTGERQRHAERILGDAPPEEGAFLTTPGAAKVDGEIYFTQCEAKATSCTTTFMPESAVLSAGRGLLAFFLGMGGLTGGIMGFVVSLLMRRRQTMHAQLLRAIRKDRLRVVYQPIVDLTTGRVTEAEALVRWTDDDNQAVPPDVFVKSAEEHGFVGELTRLVVRHVLEDFRDTMRRYPEFRVNVNIAAADLSDPGFVAMLDEALKGAGVTAPSLGVEITEGNTARQQAARETIVQLRQRGHVVHIDDFGTGYSSLSYLHDLSVDSIKIDKAFTRAIGTEAVTVSILPQILAMAEKLNLKVVVEGIETAEQARYFAGHHTVYGQGWLFGRPVTSELFHSFLRERILHPVSLEDVVLGRSQAVSMHAH
ncbi:MAG TPA: EAL domain-containing protein [Terracidiphilus sp.]|nr:EAL domain-containing protein [Terracidiphilus sp.]